MLCEYPLAKTRPQVFVYITKHSIPGGALKERALLWPGSLAGSQVSCSPWTKLFPCFPDAATASSSC